MAATRRFGRFATGFIGILVAVGTLTTPASATHARPHAAAQAPFGISAITATFKQSEFATHYTIKVDGIPAAASPAPQYVWTLALTCVDQGCPNANGTDLSPAPNVDPNCRNAPLAGGQTPTGEVTLPSGTRVASNVYQWDNQATEFVWHHGGPPLADNCDHAKQGPSGHQGIVAVSVMWKGWTCSAQLGGTEDFDPLDVAGFPGVRASTSPKCVAGAVQQTPAQLMLAGLAQVDKELTAMIDGGKSGKLSGDQIGSMMNTAYFRLVRAIEDSGGLGTFGGTNAKVGVVFSRLRSADRDFAIIPELIDGGPEGVKYVDFSFEQAAESLANIGKELNPSDEELGSSFSKLGDEANTAAKDFKDGKLTHAQAKSRASQLAKAKEALIGKLPTVHGLNAGTLYGIWVKTIAEWGAMSPNYVKANLSAALATLATAQTEKKKLEGMLAHALGK